MGVVVKKYKNPTPKPISQRCQCGKVIFLSGDIDYIISANRTNFTCPRCQSLISVTGWINIIRNKKLKRIKSKING